MTFCAHGEKKNKNIVKRETCDVLCRKIKKTKGKCTQRGSFENLESLENGKFSVQNISRKVEKFSRRFPSVFIAKFPQQ